MKDRGLVTSTQANLAEVEVRCLVDACKNCYANSMCAGGGLSKGRLTVINNLQASVGNEVEIEIPESHYNRVLILIFTSLLSGSLLGIGLGYILSRLLSLPYQEMIIIGFITSLAASGIGLFFYFRRKHGFSLYPVISKIINKGETYG